MKRVLEYRSAVYDDLLAEPSGWAVVAEGLGKRHGDRWTLRDINLYVPAGSVLCLVGCEDSGKTTLLRILAGHERPTVGYVSVAGSDGIALLDEPAAGLDPDGRAELWSTLRRHAEGGGTVILTAEDPSDAEGAADTIVFLDHGSIVDASSATTSSPPRRPIRPTRAARAEELLTVFGPADGGAMHSPPSRRR
jgi:ABC-type multidrug transport system ATPase subunit